MNTFMLLFHKKIVVILIHQCGVPAIANCVLLIHKHTFSLSSSVDHAWKGSLGTTLN